MRYINKLIQILFISILNFGFLEAQVTQEWVKRFTFTTDAGDTAYSIVVDGSGYVYVAGIVWRNEDNAFSNLYGLPPIN